MSASHSPNVSSAVFFRNGFLISESGRELDIPETWSRRTVGALDIATHPETPIVAGTEEGIHVALIGSAFDPERGIYAESAVLAQLLGDSRNQGALYETMDRLAGRFAVVVHSLSGTEIYQDAMGSRSVFYSTAGPAVAASHAELVRAVIGTHFADFFVPFVTSRNYIRRDVKYLPGVASAYEHVLQLTPNTKLLMPQQSVERFWPRETLRRDVDNETAASALVLHLEGLAASLQHQGLRPVIGLTAGTDSRGVFAAVKGLDPYIFTYVRSEKGTAVNSLDAEAAADIAGRYSLHAHAWPIPNRLTLNDADDVFSYAYRLATGYYRGTGSPWLKTLAKLDDGLSHGKFVRGFGGEVMRGFYQNMSRRIDEVSVRQLSNAYDVNSGSNITRRLFGEMMDRTQFTSSGLWGHDPNDIFYWEHRMGTWGSVSLTEADLAMPSMVGYNSRNLFTLFMGLSDSDRRSRAAFELATVTLAPKLEVLQ